MNIFGFLGSLFGFRSNVEPVTPPSISGDEDDSEDSSGIGGTKGKLHISQLYKPLLLDEPELVIKARNDDDDLITILGHLISNRVII